MNYPSNFLLDTSFNQNIKHYIELAYDTQDYSEIKQMLETEFLIKGYPKPYKNLIVYKFRRPYQITVIFEDKNTYYFNGQILCSNESFVVNPIGTLKISSTGTRNNLEYSDSNDMIKSIISNMHYVAWNAYVAPRNYQKIEYDQIGCQGILYLMENVTAKHYKIDFGCYIIRLNKNFEPIEILTG